MGKPPFQKGDQVGSYILEDIFSIGGMGVLYLVEGKKILLKAPFADSEPHILEQFREEVQALKKLVHPGIVKFLEDGVQNGIPWYAMEKLVGESLRELLKRKGKLLPLEALRIEYQMVQAMAYSHSQAKPLWHLDLKPENICLEGERPVILDFGLTRSARRTSSLLPPHGTLPYMPPEQIHGHADARTDVYALGVILYEMLSGTTPFIRHNAKDSDAALVEQILNLSLAAPALLGVDETIVTICTKALQKRAEQRYADATELIGDIKFALRKQLKLESIRMEQNKNYPATAALLREAIEYGLPIAELEEFWRFRLGRSLQVLLVEPDSLEAPKRALALQRHPYLVPILEIVEDKWPYLVVEAPTTDPLSKRISQGYYLSFRECIELCQATRISLEALKQVNLNMPLEERRIFSGAQFRISGLHRAGLGYQDVPARALADILVRALSGSTEPSWQEFPEIFREILPKACSGNYPGDAISLARDIENAWAGQTQELEDIQRWKDKLLQLKSRGTENVELAQKLAALSQHSSFEEVRAQACQVLEEIFVEGPKDGDWEKFVSEQGKPSHMARLISGAGGLLSQHRLKQKLGQWLGNLLPATESNKVQPESLIDRELLADKEFLACLENIIKKPGQLSREQVRELRAKFLTAERKQTQTRRIERERVQLLRTLLQKEELLQNLQNEREHLQHMVAEQERVIQEKDQFIEDLSKKGQELSRYHDQASGLSTSTKSDLPLERTPSKELPVDESKGLFIYFLEGDGATGQASPPPSASNGPIVLSPELWEKIEQGGKWYASPAVKLAQLLEQEFHELDYAREFLQKMLPLTAHTPVVRDALAAIYWQDNAIQALIDLYNHQLQNTNIQETPQPQLILLYENLAQLYRRVGDIDKCLPLLHRILDLQPHHLATMQHLQDIYTAQKSWEKLIEVYEAERSIPDLPMARRIALLNKVAEVRESKLEQHDAAVQSYLTLLKPELDPKNLQAIQGLQEIYRKTGRWPELQGMLLKEIEIQTDRERIVKLYLEIAHVKAERLADENGALEYFQKVHLVRPYDLEVIHHLNTIYKKKENWSEYAVLLEKEAAIIKISPGSFSLHQELMVLSYEKLGYLPQAIAHGEAAMQAKPDAIDTLVYLQQLYAKSGHKAALAKAYQKEAELLPSGERARLFFLELEAGKIYAELGESSAAVDCLQKALRLQPYHREALEYLARLLSSTRRWNELSEVYEQFVQVAPQSEEREDIYCKLAALWDKEFGEIGKALSYYQAAYELNHNNLVAVQRMRLLLERQERWAEAIQMMEVELNLLDKKKQPTLYFAIGQIWEEKLRVSTQAIKAYQKVMSYGFHRSTATRLQRLLESVGDFAGVASLLERDIRITPLKSPELLEKLRYLAEIYWKKLRAPERATRLYYAMLKCDRNNMEVLCKLENLLEEQQQWKALVKILSLRIKRMPGPEEQFPILSKLARVYEEKLGHGERAIVWYERALAFSPNHLDTIHALQKLYTDWGLYHQLVGLYEKELSLVDAPQRLRQIYYNLGEIWDARLFDLRKAIYNFEKVWQLTPEPAIASILANLYRRGSLWQQLTQMLPVLINEAKQQENLVQEIDLRLELGRVSYEQLHEIDKAVACLSQVLEIEPLQDEAFQTLSNVYEKEKQNELLAKLLEDRCVLLVTEPSSLQEVLIRLANLYDKCGKAEQAITTWQKVLENTPDHREALASLQRLYHAKGNWEALAETLIQELSLVESPEQKAELLYLLGVVYAEHKQNLPRGKSLWEEAVKQQPAHTASLSKLAQIAQQQGRWEEAVQYFTRAADTTENPAVKVSLLLPLGDIYREHALPDKACKAYESVLYIMPDEIKALEPLAALYFEESKWAEAGPLYLKLTGKIALGDKVNLALLYYRWGVISEALNNNEAAIARYIKAVELEPEFIDPTRALAELYWKCNDWEHAREVYAKLYQYENALVPPQTERWQEVVYRLASLEDKLGHGEEAITYYEKLLASKDGRSASIYKALLRLHSERHDYSQALSCCESLLKIATSDSEKWEILQSKANLLVKQGEPKRAIEALLQALQYHPADISILTFLIELYLTTGEFEKARFRNDQIYPLLLDSGERIKNRCLKGHILWQSLHQTEPAVGAYKEALAMDPGCVTALEEIAHIYTSEDNWRALAKAYGDFLQKLPAEKQELGFPFRIALGHLLHSKLEDAKGAIEQFREALLLKPDHVPTQIALAELKTRLPEYEKEAIDAHFLILQHDPFRIPSYNALNMLLPKYDRAKEALGVYRALGLLYPEHKVENIWGEEVHAHRPKQVPPKIGAGLMPNSLRPTFDSLVLLGDCFAHRVSFAQLEHKYGIKRNQHLQRQKSYERIWHYACQTANILGTPEIRVYISPAQQPQLALENTQPPSLIISQPLFEALSPEEIQWLFAKYMFYITQKHLFALQLNANELRHMLMALIDFVKHRPAAKSWHGRLRDFLGSAYAQRQKYQQTLHFLVRPKQLYPMLRHAYMQRDKLWQNLWKAVRSIPEKLGNVAVPRHVRLLLLQHPELVNDLHPEEMELYLRWLDFASNHLALLVSDSLSLSLQMCYLLQQIRQGKVQLCSEILPWEELKNIAGIRELLACNISGYFQTARISCDWEARTQEIKIKD